MDEMFSKTAIFLLFNFFYFFFKIGNFYFVQFLFLNWIRNTKSEINFEKSSEKKIVGGYETAIASLFFGGPIFLVDLHFWWTNILRVVHAARGSSHMTSTNREYIGDIYMKPQFFWEIFCNLESVNFNIILFCSKSYCLFTVKLSPP